MTGISKEAVYKMARKKLGEGDESVMWLTTPHPGVTDHPTPGAALESNCPTCIWLVADLLAAM
jgi:hypothetical protein